MGRTDRRAQERRQRQEDKKKATEAAWQLEQDVKQFGIFDAYKAVTNPCYLSQITKQRVAQQKQWEQNGITKADLKAEYNKGYAAARRDLAAFTAQMFYSAIAISLHRLLKFGETRICRILDDVQLIMTEEICTDDIIRRCREETGIKIVENGYDN